VPDVIRYLNTVLDRAERLGWWVPVVAGLSTGTGTGQVLQHQAWAWGLLAAGLVLMAIRPAGTAIRARYRIRRAKRLLDAAKAGDLGAYLDLGMVVDDLERSAGIRKGNGR